MILQTAILLVTVAVPPSVSTYQHSLQVTLQAQYQAFYATAQTAAAEAHSDETARVTPHTQTALLQAWSAWAYTLSTLSTVFDDYSQAFDADDPDFPQRRMAMHEAVLHAAHLLALATEQGAFAVFTSRGEELARTVDLTAMSLTTEGARWRQSASPGSTPRGADLRSVAALHGAFTFVSSFRGYLANANYTTSSTLVFDGEGHFSTGANTGRGGPGRYAIDGSSLSLLYPSGSRSVCALEVVGGRVTSFNCNGAVYIP